jgi:NAD(P)-dependent dehydrogenase (short-subunit alcohol dehydrogenase family)
MVTGGGSGLGAATARQLVAHGAKVMLIDISTKAAELADELGNSASFVRADVTDAVQAQCVMDDFAANHGELSGLINCAGVAPAEKVVGRDGPHGLDSFIRTVHVNLVGAFNMLRLAATLMTKNEPTPEGERGVIVNTASIAAYDGQIGQAGYAASKGGVVAMTLPIARELARFGIRVCAIAPGIMETPMLASMPLDVQQALGKMVPFPPRLGRPDEFAGLVLHILENSYLNGEVIRLDGAIRMAPK